MGCSLVALDRSIEKEAIKKREDFSIGNSSEGYSTWTCKKEKKSVV